MTALTLTVKEIIDLTRFANITLDESRMPTGDDLETEICIADCPATGILDDDNKPVNYRLIAYDAEYPEEGCMGLGDEIK